MLGVDYNDSFLYILILVQRFVSNIQIRKIYCEIWSKCMFNTIYISKIDVEFNVFACGLFDIPLWLWNVRISVYCTLSNVFKSLPRYSEFQTDPLSGWNTLLLYSIYWLNRTITIITSWQISGLSPFTDSYFSKSAINLRIIAVWYQIQNHVNNRKQETVCW